MAWDRTFLKNRIKSSMFLDRNVEDGLLTDDLLDESIDEAIKIVADDCHLMPRRVKVALRANVWEIPMPDDILSIRRIWYKDGTGYRYELTYLSPERFMDNEDPTDTASDPLYFSYPTIQSKVYQFYAQAPPIYDYVTSSWITEKTVRTVVDSGINLGKTLDGSRVKPGDVVHNLTDDSYGYVHVLDITTDKTTGTGTSGTTTAILEDTAADFVTDGVAVGDIICTPSTGNVTSYAFVTAVAATELTYTAYQDPDNDTSSFAEDDTYKVGTATEIILSIDEPHPGLRDGATNDFTISDSAKATITGTTFTDTTVTGSSTSGAEEDDIAIASGGSHGLITAVDDNELTVDKWIGGLPSAAETVTVYTCDQYQVESKFATQKLMWINPAPSDSDTLGEESLEILYNRMPHLPIRDSDPIEIPEKYSRPLVACCRWQAYFIQGNIAEDQVFVMEQRYNTAVRPFMADIWKTPRSSTLTPWKNRSPGRYREHRYTTSSGASYDVSGIV